MKENYQYWKGSTFSRYLRRSKISIAFPYREGGGPLFLSHMVDCDRNLQCSCITNMYSS
jgi:hypothetical protein